MPLALVPLFVLVLDINENYGNRQNDAIAGRGVDGSNLLVC